MAWERHTHADTQTEQTGLTGNSGRGKQLKIRNDREAHSGLCKHRQVATWRKKKRVCKIQSKTLEKCIISQQTLLIIVLVLLWSPSGDNEVGVLSVTAIAAFAS